MKFSWARKTCMTERSWGNGREDDRGKRCTHSGNDGAGGAGCRTRAGRSEALRGDENERRGRGARGDRRGRGLLRRKPRAGASAEAAAGGVCGKAAAFYRAAANEQGQISRGHGGPDRIGRSHRAAGDHRQAGAKARRGAAHFIGGQHRRAGEQGGLYRRRSRPACGKNGRLSRREAVRTHGDPARERASGR